MSEKIIKNKRLIEIFVYALLFRITIYLLYIVICLTSNQYNGGFSFADYFEAWVRWDATPYLDVAKYGYGHYQENGQHLYLVFLPMYPWLIKTVSFVVRNYQLSGLIVSTFSYSLGCVYLYKMVNKLYGDDVAINTIIMISIYPFSFFIGGIMTEGLFFLLASAFLYYLFEEKYYLVAFVGFIACLTKLQGGFLAFVVLVKLADNANIFKLIINKEIKKIWSDFLLPGLKCVPMLLGILVYLLINNKVDGNPFAFMRYQEEHWYHTVGPIWNTLKYMIEHCIGNRGKAVNACIWIPQIVLLFLILVLILYAFKVKLDKSLITYLIIFYLVTFSSTWLISGGRYAVSIIPMFILLSIFVVKHPKVKQIVYTLSFGIMVVYMAAYFNWQQIM